MAEDKENIHQEIITGCILSQLRPNMHPVFFYKLSRDCFVFYLFEPVIEGFFCDEVGHLMPVALKEDNQHNIPYDLFSQML